MVQMVQEYLDRLKKKYIYYSNRDKIFYIKIAMVIILIIIAILLVKKINVETKSDIKNEIDTTQLLNDNKLEVSTDEGLISFIINYFNDRLNLKYESIFNAYNKKYSNVYQNEEEQEIIKVINYENAFIKKYDNFVIYSIKGIKENETVALITYDMYFSWTNDFLPSIIIAYIIKDNNKYYFKDDLNVATSKYISEIIRTEQVVEIYNEYQDIIDKKLKSNDDLKLAYNSYRQYEINDYNNINKNLLDEINNIEIDPIKDNEKIKQLIEEKKNNF